MPGLSFDVVVAHILREEHLHDDPAELAILRAVSRGMCDAVDATGRKVEEVGEEDAVKRGYTSTLKCLRRRGERMSSVHYSGEERRPSGVEGVARREFPVERVDERFRGVRRPPRGAEVGARERLPVARSHAPTRGFVRRRRHPSRQCGTVSACRTKEPRRGTANVAGRRDPTRTMNDENHRN